MGLLPSSPRRRRRVLTLGGAGTAALIVVLVFFALPSSHPPNPNVRAGAPAAQLAARQSHHVSAADRKGIDEAFDHFIPNALNRKNAAEAWAYAGPSLRVDSSLAQWKKGTMAVPEYPAAGTAFHGWRALDATPTEVDYSLLVHPRAGSNQSQWAFQGTLLKIHGRWVVDTIYTTAIMAKPHNGFREVGPADFAAQGNANSGEKPSDKPALSRTWLSTLIGVLVGVLVLVPLGLGIGILLRRRRWQQRLQAEGRNELPSLPPGARKAEERDKTPVA